MGLVREKKEDGDSKRGELGGSGASGVPPFSSCGPVNVAGERVLAHKELAMDGEERPEVKGTVTAVREA